MVYIAKQREEILRSALRKLEDKTPITAVGPGSVARALTESVTDELGDFYDVMSFNSSMNFISTATGRALDMMGALYSLPRKRLGSIASLDQTTGAFYFYIDAPHTADINIPDGVIVSTDDTFVGETYSYVTVTAGLIPAGRTRVYVGIRPEFSDSAFTAGKHTLTKHNAEEPAGVTIRCTNPKAVAPQVGYESDDNYRDRIIKSVRVSAGATMTAVRYAALAVPGVREVVVNDIPYGLGSAEVLVVPEERGNANLVVSEAASAIGRVRPMGVRVFVREPDYLPIDIDATVVIRKDVNVDRTGVANRAEIGIVRYLNTLLPGKELIYSALLQAVLQASESIKDIKINKMKIGGVEILRRNYEVDTFQQIVPGYIEVDHVT